MKIEFNILTKSNKSSFDFVNSDYVVFENTGDAYIDSYIIGIIESIKRLYEFSIDNKIDKCSIYFDVDNVFDDK